MVQHRRLTVPVYQAFAFALLFIAGCASRPPVYDVPVVEPEAPDSVAVPELQPEVETRTPQRDNPATVTLLAASAEAAQAGNHQLAISHIERAIRLEPKNSALWSELSLAYLADGRSQRARQYAQKAIALAGDRGDLKRKGWLAIADVEAAEGNLAEARRIRRLYRAARG